MSVIRPVFKGPSVAAAVSSLEELERLGTQLGFEVVIPDLAGAVRAASGAPLPSYAVHDAEAAARAAAQLREAALDFLLIQHTTFATGDVLTPLLQACERVGVWALPEAPGGAEAGGGPLPLNSLCGVNMTLSYLGAPEVAKAGPVKWFYGRADSDWFVARLSSTVAALRGLKALSEARVLHIGGTAPGFYGLTEELGLEGPTVDTLPLAALFDRIAQVGQLEVSEAAAATAKAEPLDVGLDQLERATRIELALTALAREGGYHALAVRCWPELPDQCDSMACLALGNLSHGTPAACEGDVTGALSMLALQAVTGGSTMLLDLSDLDEAADALLFWHCGNAPREWAAGGTSRLTTHFNRDGVGVVRDMVIAPGPVTGFRLVGTGAALVVGGEFGEPRPASYDGVRGWLEHPSWNGRSVSARGYVGSVLDLRLAHHFAFGRGEHTAALQELCTWLGREPLEAVPTSSALLPPPA